MLDVKKAVQGTRVNLHVAFVVGAAQQGPVAQKAKRRDLAAVFAMVFVLSEIRVSACKTMASRLESGAP
jgi:hypothetical protein